jgi:hypothetical protein
LEAQVAGSLPSKLKAMSSNTSTAKKEKKWEIFATCIPMISSTEYANNSHTSIRK